jgi:hypothetical protein
VEQILLNSFYKDSITPIQKKKKKDKDTNKKRKRQALMKLGVQILNKVLEVKFNIKLKRPFTIAGGIYPKDTRMVQH